MELYEHIMYAVEYDAFTSSHRHIRYGTVVLPHAIWLRTSIRRIAKVKLSSVMGG